MMMKILDIGSSRKEKMQKSTESLSSMFVYISAFLLCTHHRCTMLTSLSPGIYAHHLLPLPFRSMFLLSPKKKRIFFCKLVQHTDTKNEKCLKVIILLQKVNLCWQRRTFVCWVAHLEHSHEFSSFHICT